MHKLVHALPATLSAVVILALFSSCGLQNRREIQLSNQIPEVDYEREARVLTAFFGLDEMPRQALALWTRAMGKNGMPLVFSQELDPETLDASDFQITTADGTTFDLEFVTLLPANEAFELRTALFIGEYGSHPDNPPVSVEIVGDLMSRTGKNHKGQTIAVIPLPEGPIVSYAEHFVIDEDYPYVEKGAGCDCPREKTKQVVRTVWAGGVRATNGEELGINEMEAFEVTLVQGSDTVTVTPFLLADLKDNDNNIDLCLNETGTPVYVNVRAGIAIDPRGDVNPETGVEVVSRW